MDAAKTPPRANGAGTSKSVEKAASRSPASASSGGIPELPNMDLDFDAEMEDIEDIVRTSPVKGKRATTPRSDRAVDEIAGSPGGRSPKSASPTGNIVATILPEESSPRATRATADVVSLSPTRGKSTAVGSGEEKRKAVVSSLNQKETGNQSENSSPMSAIPNLPTEPITTRSYTTRSSASAAAESSAQAARRARKPPAPKKTKADTLPAKVTRQSLAKNVVEPKADPPKKAGKRTRGEQRSEEEVEEDQEDDKAQAPETKKRRGVKEQSGSADVEDEPLKTVDEAGVEEKPVGRGMKRKVAPKPVRTRQKPTKKTRPISDAQLRDRNKGKTREVQALACLRSRYTKWGKCTGCTAKSGTDGCRFRDFRTFPVDPKTGEIIGPGFFESTNLVDEPAALPSEFSVPLTNDHLRRIEESAAPILLPLITREVRHVSKSHAITRAVDIVNDRSYCDFCSCTIFAGYFFCKTCGRDYCLSCERYFSDAVETMDQSPWHLVTAARTRLLRCLPPPDPTRDPAGPSSRINSQPPTWHFRGDLQPVSALSEEELTSHWLVLADYAVKGEEPKSDWPTLFGYDKAQAPNLTEEIEQFRTEYKEAVDEDRPAPTPIDLKSLYTKYTRPGIPLPVDPANLREQSLEFMRISAPEVIDNSAFDQIWSKGEPIVIDGVADRFDLNWTPNEMISQFGKEPCEISDCEKDVPWGATIKEFFESFKEHDRDTKGIWKLQDWPAKEGFQKKHPALYDDFCGALPVPDFTQQNGAMNLYARFPRGPTKPDIGPKMYCAFTGKETRGGHGSTRLHMDVADAINIMLYASPSSAAREDVASVPAATDAEPAAATAEAPADAAPAPPAAPASAPEVEEPEAPIAESSRSTRTKSRSLSTKSATRPTTRGKRTEPTAAPAPAPAPEPSAAAASAPEPIVESEEDPQYPGCAVWDVFRAEDADKLRTFLERKFAKSKIDFTDPIHSQMFYLDAKLRKELWETMGVASFRIYQYPGQAVFIPAGCAHQVCNLADCIKIAMDFVSPHNVSRCQQLTQDFRKENFVKVWKDDVLQLYNILWFAWLSSRETREQRRKETEPKPAESPAQPKSDDLRTLLASSQSNIGRGQVSSVRDDPADGLRLDMPPPPTLAGAAVPPIPAETAVDPAKALVAKLLAAALSAPEPEPPADARPPIIVKTGGWGRARNAEASSSGVVPRKRTRASMAAGGGMEEAREPTPMMTVGAARALAASGRRVNKASDAFKEEIIPYAFVEDLIMADMGQGGDEEMDEGVGGDLGLERARAVV